MLDAMVPKVTRTTVTTSIFHTPEKGTTRVMVRWIGRQKQVPWDYALSTLEAHRHGAADALGIPVEELELIGHAESGTSFIWATKESA